MKEKLRKKLRSFLIGMTFPVLFSSGCAQSEKNIGAGLPSHLSFIDADTLRDDFFKHYFDSSNWDFTGSEFLLSDEEIADRIELSKTTSECDFEWDGDIEKVKEIIKSNSIEFLKQRDRYESAFCDLASDNDLFSIQLEFENSLDFAISNFLSDAQGNVDEDICRLQEISAVFGDLSSGSLGEFRNDIIILDYKNILESATHKECEFADILCSTLSHELNHVRQSICEHRFQSGQRYDEISCSNIVPSFFIESSAESFLYNMGDHSYYDDYSDYTYFYQREHEALLFLFAICHENVACDAYYNAIFDTDLKKFYQFFDCETEDDIYDLYKILSAMDAALGRSPKLDHNTIKTIGEAKEIVGEHYKVNIFDHILSDMVDYTRNHSDFSLEDNLTLFKIVRSVLTIHSYHLEETVNGDLERIYDLEFVSSFKSSEDMYYHFLSLYYQTDISEMKCIEEGYTNEVMNALNTFCMDGTMEYSHFNEVTSLLDKFPLLEPVLKATDVNYFDYSSFVENNSVVYEKKK